jgi:hypothetical protein
MGCNKSQFHVIQEEPKQPENSSNPDTRKTTDNTEKEKIDEKNIVITQLCKLTL